MDDRVAEPHEILAAVIAASWGPVHLAASANGIVAVALSSTAEAFEADLARRRLGPIVRWIRLADEPVSGDRAATAGEVLSASRTETPAFRHLRTAAAAIEARDTRSATRPAGPEATVGRAGEVTLDLHDRPAWDRAVLEAVRAIPRGEVRSYGQIARAVDRPGAARAVGGAVGRNPVAFLVPCHRVVAGDGTLGGYGGGWWGDHERLLDLKAELLAGEGVHLPRSPSRRSRSG